MQVTPTFSTVGKFFNGELIYKVPKYQRSYAWEKNEINSFLNDLEVCFKSRKTGNAPVNHFFGGIVSVKHDIAGAVSMHHYELVDGQQRMATFVILVAALIKIHKEIQKKLSNSDPNVSIVNNRINNFKRDFIEFELEINLKSQSEDVLSLSRADSIYFKDLIRNPLYPTPNRASHEKLLKAFKLIYSRIKKITQDSNVKNYLLRLGYIDQVIKNDFKILHIITQNKQEAYTLFQVLNNRGKSLTEGDLLRAKTLELLENHDTKQDLIEALWDKILEDYPNATLKYLKWVYISYQGKSATTNKFLDDFLDAFYPSHNNKPENIIEAQAEKILVTTQSINKEFTQCRKLMSREWPYTYSAPITQWDRDRLHLLVLELGHTLCMPLLLSAIEHLNHKKFSELIQVIERFIFRYIYVCGQHAGDVGNIYNNAAVQIRNNSFDFNIFKQELRALQNTNANDDLFSEALKTKLIYSESGRSNKALKYFLMSCEYYYRWYSSNPRQALPKCMDKTLVYSFADTTIEHIYPRNPDANDIDQALEDAKNTLGNLTFMGPSDNVTGANDNFLIKKPIFKASSVKLNSEVIAPNTKWTIAEVEAHAELLKNIAMQVFKI